MSLEPEQPSITASGNESISGRRVLVAVAATLGMFLAALDTSLNVALPSMTEDLNADLQSIQWVIVAFIATQAALVMGAGSFADRFGLRPVYIFGATTYLAAMFAIAFSPNLETVVGFRVLQALGTGCLFAVSPAIAAGVFPSRRRGLSMGFAVGSQALGMLAGTIGAGLLVGWIGWEWIFLGRTPFAVAAIILGVWFLEAKRLVGRAGFRCRGGGLSSRGAALLDNRLEAGPFHGLGLTCSSYTVAIGARISSRFLASGADREVAGIARLSGPAGGIHSLKFKHVLGQPGCLCHLVHISFLCGR